MDGVHKPHWSVYLWPGLPHLWMRGSWAGLLLAVGFAALWNVLLVGTLVWREWLPVHLRFGLACLTGAIWALAYLEAKADWRRMLRERALRGDAASLEQLRDQWFRAAQRHYLRGDWPEVHKLLQQLLKVEPRDAEAQLLYATLLRHEGRLLEARDALERLARWETAQRWEWEMSVERQSLLAAEDAAQRPAELESAEAVADSAAPPTEPAASAALPATLPAASADDSPASLRLPLPGPIESPRSELRRAA